MKNVNISQKKYDVVTCLTKSIPISTSNANINFYKNNMITKILIDNKFDCNTIYNLNSRVPEKVINVSPGERTVITFEFDKDIDENTMIIVEYELFSTQDQAVFSTPNYFRRNPSFPKRKIDVFYTGLSVGNYAINIFFISSINQKLCYENTNDIVLTVKFGITSICLNDCSSNVLLGSTEGGTQLIINGGNFISQSDYFGNQFVLIGNTICDITKYEKEKIICITRKPEKNTLLEKEYNPRVEVFNDYVATCETCKFKYTQIKTPILKTVYNENFSYFSLKYDIAIPIYLNANQGDFLIMEFEIVEEQVNYFSAYFYNKEIDFSWGRMGQFAFLNGNEGTPYYKTYKIKGKILEIFEDQYGLNLFNLRIPEIGFFQHSPTNNYYSLFSDAYIKSTKQIYIYLRKQIQIVNFDSNELSSFGQIFKITLNYSDFLKFPSNYIQICAYKCKIITNSILNSANNPKEIICLLNTEISYSGITTNYYNRNVCSIITISYYGNLFSFNSPSITAKSSNNALIKNFQIYNSFNSDKSLTDPKNSVEVLMNLSIIFNLLEFKLKLLINYKYLFDFSQENLQNAIYKIKLPNGLPSGRINLIAYIEGKGILNPPFNLRIKENDVYLTEFFYDIPLKVEFPKEVKDYKEYLVSYNGGFKYDLIGTNFDGKIANANSLDNISLNSCFNKITICDLPVLNFDSISHDIITLRTPRIIPLIKDDDNFKSLLDDFKNLLEDPIYENIVQISNEDSKIFNSTMIKANLLDNNPFTDLKFSSANNLLINFTDIFWSQNKNFLINLKKIKIFISKDFNPIDLRDAQLQGFNSTHWIDIITIPINIPFMWYSFDVTYIIKGSNEEKIDLDYAYEKYRIKTNSNLSISEIRIYGNLIYKNIDKEKKVKCNIKIWDNINYVPVYGINFTYNVDSTFFLNYQETTNKKNLYKSTEGVSFRFAQKTSLPADVSKYKIKFYGMEKILTQNDFQISNQEIKVLNLPMKNANNLSKFDRNSKLIIEIIDSGYIYTGSYYIPYYDDWSDSDSWKFLSDNYQIPLNLENVLIKNTDISLGNNIEKFNFNNFNSTLKINNLIIDNGSLFIDNKNFKTLNLYIRSIVIRNNGILIIGNEDSYNSINIVFYGDSNNYNLPNFGSKSITIFNGKLNIFGNKNFLFNSEVVSNNFNKNDNQIIIPSSSIKGIKDKLSVNDLNFIGSDFLFTTKGRNSSPVYKTIYSQNLDNIYIVKDSSNESIDLSNYQVNGFSNNYNQGNDENYNINENSLYFNSKVFAMNRNIILQGDENMESSNYGLAIKIFIQNSAQMNDNLNPIYNCCMASPNKSIYYDLSNKIANFNNNYNNYYNDDILIIEYALLKNIGQKFNRNRNSALEISSDYPLKSSSIYGNNFINSNSRGIKLNKIQNIEIQSNLFYNITGQMLTFETGSEMDNIIEGNFFIKNYNTFEIARGDSKAAQIKIRNLNNKFFQNFFSNSASDAISISPGVNFKKNFGYVLPSKNINFCPSEISSSESNIFDTNTILNSQETGIYITNYNPKTFSCVDFDMNFNFSKQKKFQNIISAWNNKGIYIEKSGSILFDTYKSIEEEISTFTAKESFKDLSTGLTLNNIYVSCKLNLNNNLFYIIEYPKNEDFEIINLNLQSNCNQKINIFTTCSECSNYDLIKDYGDRLVKFSKINYNINKQNIQFTILNININFLDLIYSDDSSLLINSNNSYNWIVPYFEYLDDLNNSINSNDSNRSGSSNNSNSPTKKCIKADDDKIIISFIGYWKVLICSKEITIRRLSVYGIDKIDQVSNQMQVASSTDPLVFNSKIFDVSQPLKYSQIPNINLFNNQIGWRIYVFSGYSYFLRFLKKDNSQSYRRRRTNFIINKNSSFDLNKKNHNKKMRFLENIDNFVLRKTFTFENLILEKSKKITQNEPVFNIGFEYGEIRDSIITQIQSKTNSSILIDIPKINIDYNEISDFLKTNVDSRFFSGNLLNYKSKCRLYLKINTKNPVENKSTNLLLIKANKCNSNKCQNNSSEPCISQCDKSCQSQKCRIERDDCIECNYEDSYFPLFNQTNKCLRFDNLTEDLFVDEKKKMIFPCDISCKNCTKTSTNCTFCNMQKNYFAIDGENKPYKCYLSKPKSGYYYSKEKLRWALCHKSCKECFENDFSCTECNSDNKYFKLENKENKIICSENIPKRYYLDEEKKMIKLCPNQCMECSDSTNCISCYEDEAYYRNPKKSELECTNESIPGFYRDFKANKYKKCHESCATCINNEFCTKCDSANGYLSLPNYNATTLKINQFKCTKDCPIKHIKNPLKFSCKKLHFYYFFENFK